MTDLDGADNGNAEWLGEVPIAKNGTMTLPQKARSHLRLALDAPGKVLVFTEPGRVTITAVPGNLSDALLQLAVGLSLTDTAETATSEDDEADVDS